jgi:negative elongation factor C/D
MQPEREEEVAAAGSTLVGYFGVFHRLTAARLRQVAAARSVEELARPAREIREGCARSQHAYAHTQHLLAWLAAEGGPGAARFRRLSQELEAAAAEAAGPAALKMQRWFTPGGGGGGGAAAVAAAVADVLAVASGVSAAPSSDVLKLYRMYCPPPGEGAPPAAAAVGPLRQPRLIEVLLRGLFNPGRQLAGEAATAHVTLLSLATAALEPAKGAGAEPAAAAAAAAAMEVDGAAAAAAAGAPQPASALLDQPGVASARAALESAAHVGHKALRDEALSEAEAAAAVAAAGHSVAAAGLLGMLRARLTSPDYWTTSYHVHKEPPFLALLSAIVARQPDMHGQALTLVTDALAAMGTSASGPDVARGLLDVALQLLAAGRADEVLRWGEAWARNADAGLVRHLTFGLLRRAAPPYSPAFAAAVLRLMAVGGMRRQRVGGREWAVRAPLLEEFERGCAGVAFSPPLAGEAAAALRELGAGLRAGRQQG